MDSSASPATPSTETATAVPVKQSLKYLPVPIFSTVMGTTGLALVWLKAHGALGMPLLVGEGLRGIASALFVLLLVLYGLKALRYPEAVAMEVRHPVRVSFVPTVSISLLLLAISYLDSAPTVALWLWIVGLVLHLGLTLAIFGSWLHDTHYTIQHVSPAWFIPIVGNIVVPVAGAKLGFPELSWFFFSNGLVFWLMLLAIVLYRLIFHEPLPPRLVPTFFILLAPPSVGFIAYVNLTGTVDNFARILYYTALFLGLLLASHAVRFLRLPFFISIWAYSFPLAALTLATLIMSTHLPSMAFLCLAIGLLAFLSLVLAALALRTLIGVWRGEICVPE